METIYQAKGYQDRKDYLLSLADELDLDPEVVFAAAQILGENEDFDGLVTTLEDYAEMFEQ